MDLMSQAEELRNASNEALVVAIGLLRTDELLAREAETIQHSRSSNLLHGLDLDICLP